MQISKVFLAVFDADTCGWQDCRHSLGGRHLLRSHLSPQGWQRRRLGDSRAHPSCCRMSRAILSPRSCPRAAFVDLLPHPAGSGGLHGRQQLVWGGHAQSCMAPTLQISLPVLRDSIKSLLLQFQGLACLLPLKNKIPPHPNKQNPHQNREKKPKTKPKIKITTENHSFHDSREKLGRKKRKKGLHIFISLGFFNFFKK